MHPVVLWLLIGLLGGLLAALFVWGLRHYDQSAGTAALHRIDELEDRIDELNGAIANLVDRVENLEVIASDEGWSDPREEGNGPPPPGGTPPPEDDSNSSPDSS